MPTYVYEILDEHGEGTETYFEMVQSMSEDALEAHPETGAPVRRVPQLPNIAGTFSPLKAKGQLSNSNLERLGFTKYERKGDGYMERTVGKEGPASIGGGD